MLDFIDFFLGREMIAIMKRGRRHLLLAGLLGLACVACSGRGGMGAGEPSTSRTPTGPAPPTERAATYRLYVANESSDLVSRVAFTPGAGAKVEAEIPVGIMPADNDGAHGLTVSPDGRHWYVTIAHGTPFGYVWKFRTGVDSLVSSTELGLFPATMGVTPDGQFLLAVNFNLHGDMVPSDVSVLHTPSMTEISRIVTCLMPHGSRVNQRGDKQYSACMHSDQLVEIGLTTFQITQRMSLVPGQEEVLPPSDRGEKRSMAGMEGMEGMDHGAMESSATCSPTWVEPALGSRANRFVYVACNKNGEVIEISTESWTVTRRFPTGKGPYNLEATPDGRYLVATLKGARGIAIFDLEEGKELARLSTTQPVTHGVVASPDSRYVFVSNEAVGSTPGTLDVFDLHTLQRVASLDLRYQPGGIDFWEMTEPDG